MTKVLVRMNSGVQVELPHYPALCSVISGESTPLSIFKDGDDDVYYDMTVKTFKNLKPLMDLNMMLLDDSKGGDGKEYIGSVQCETLRKQVHVAAGVLGEANPSYTFDTDMWLLAWKKLYPEEAKHFRDDTVTRRMRECVDPKLMPGGHVVKVRVGVYKWEA